MLQHLACNRREKQHPENQPVNLGYKTAANKIDWGSGKSIYGAPVQHTTPEMTKLIRQLNSRSFKEGHPVMQASYAHYALVAIHPFLDGNGRVARWLAFSFIYRAFQLPTLSLKDDARQYAVTLREADIGNYCPFIKLMEEAVFTSEKQVSKKIRHARKIYPNTK